MIEWLKVSDLAYQHIATRTRLVMSDQYTDQPHIYVYYFDDEEGERMESFYMSLESLYRLRESMETNSIEVQLP